jgi:DNA polymerase-3 subunit epsilon
MPGVESGEDESMTALTKAGRASSKNLQKWPQGNTFRYQTGHKDRYTRRLYRLRAVFMSEQESLSAGDAEQLARRLERHPAYRILRRLPERSCYAEPDGRPLARGAVVDTETTGLSLETDAIIEFAMVVFEYCRESGRVYRILEIFDQLEDPGMPIPPESTEVHGITDDMVAGKRIDDERVAELVQGLELVIAHNARFDRPFLEHRLPIFTTLPWACSLQQVGWSAESMASAKLEYLAYRMGFFYDAHRAQTDCLALLELLQMPLPVSGRLALACLLEKAHGKDYRVYAVRAPFDSKDLLKARTYRWDPERRCWHRTLSGEMMSAEIAWLKTHVYGGRPASLDFEAMDAHCRFSMRPGKEFNREI